MLLKGCFVLNFALEFIDKIIHSISAQITVGFWLYYAYEVRIKQVGSGTAKTWIQAGSRCDAQVGGAGGYSLLPHSHVLRVSSISSRTSFWRVLLAWKNEQISLVSEEAIYNGKFYRPSQVRLPSQPDGQIRIVDLNCGTSVMNSIEPVDGSGWHNTQKLYTNVRYQPYIVPQQKWALCTPYI